MAYEINRSAILIKGTKKFQEYLIATIGDITSGDKGIEEMNSDPTIYLIPEIDDEEMKNEILEEFCKDILENELSGWITDKKLWPRKRDFALFKEWFDITFCSMVYDLGDEKIEEIEV